MKMFKVTMYASAEDNNTDEDTVKEAVEFALDNSDTIPIGSISKIEVKEEKNDDKS